MGDLSMRRGKITKIENRPDAQVIAALVPLSEMFGYSTKLRSASQGRAIYTMQFDSYQRVSESIASEIVHKTGGVYQPV